MNEPIRINQLEIENVKRIKAVKVELGKNGLTVIGGKNAQGKTSVLDSIAWVLGGNKFKPSKPQREGSVIPPNLKITLSNGLVVERKGKNSDLKVTDPTGGKAGQNLLDSFVEELALNLPKFMQATNKDKANNLLQIVGVGDQLYKLENKEQHLYNERLVIGRVADQKEKFAKEQKYYEGVPADLVSPNQLIQQQQAILAKNGENQRKRDNVALYESQLVIADSKVKQYEQQLAHIQMALTGARNEYQELLNNLEIARTDILILQDESTEELEQNIANIEEINRKVRANLNKDKAEEDAKVEKANYDQLTTEIEDIRKEKYELLNGANLPLEGLFIEDGELTYKGQKWDNMSSSEQLRVATAIVRRLNPNCGFVLIDKLEQMDIDTMKEFGQWLEQEGLQAIATRVSTGDECSIIIEDGYVKGEEVYNTSENSVSNTVSNTVTNSQERDYSQTDLLGFTRKDTFNGFNGGSF